jgi:hypothetical protein
VPNINNKGVYGYKAFESNHTVHGGTIANSKEINYRLGVGPDFF